MIKTIFISVYNVITHTLRVSSIKTRIKTLKIPKLFLVSFSSLRVSSIKTRIKTKGAVDSNMKDFSLRVSSIKTRIKTSTKL